MTPIKALFVCAVINGIAAVPIMVVVMRLAGNAKAMGRFTLLFGRMGDPDAGLLKRLKSSFNMDEHILHSD